MKALTALFLIFVSTFSFYAAAQIAPLNVQIKVLGFEGAPPATADYDAIRSAIGSLVADIRIKKYTLKSVTPEGGFVVCLEANGQEGYQAMLESLTAITVDDSRTSYETEVVNSCGF